MNWLLAALIVSLTIIGLHDSSLYDKPELWTGSGRIFDSLYDFAIAYVMSYIFYLIVFIPQRRKELKMKQNSMIYINEIIECADQVRDSLDKAFPSGNALTNLKLLKGNQTSPISHTFDNQTGFPIFDDWNTFLGESAQKIQTVYSNLGPYMLFIEADLVSKISTVAECRFCRTVRNNLTSNFIQNTDLAFLSEDAAAFFDYIDDLKRYLEIKS